MSRSVPAPLAAVGALVLAASVAGCSAGSLSGSASGGGSGASGNSGSSTAPSAASGGSNRPFTLPPACLSAAEVATTLGVDAYGPTKTGDSTSLVCEYLTATKDGSIIDIAGLKSSEAGVEALAKEVLVG